jgi:hypothetical protein
MVDYEKAWKQLEKELETAIREPKGSTSHLPTLLVVQGSMSFIKANATKE